MNTMRSPAEKLAYSAAFTALGLILSYVEAMLPLTLIIPIPGFKLGLASLAVTVAFFTLGLPYALAVSLCRILLSSLLFGSVTSFWFSLLGGVLSFSALVLYRFVLKDKLGVLGLSVLAAALHNIGQTLAASAIFGYYVIFAYLPVLLAVACVTGSLTALLAHRLINIKFLYKSLQR